MKGFKDVNYFLLDIVCIILILVNSLAGTSDYFLSVLVILQLKIIK